MGYRLHVRKVNKIEYGDISVFNGSCADEINSLIRKEAGSLYEAEDGSEIELPKEDFRQGIESLKEMTDEEFAGKYKNLVQEGYTREKVIGYFEGFLEEADPDSEYIYFDWF